MINCPLPFFNNRKKEISMLVLHSMAHSAEEGIKSLEGYELSAHYIVDYDGTVFNCVDEKHRAWHAGLGSWKGLDDINSRSIGIEICHKSLGQSKFNHKQIKSLIALCRDIIARNNIRSDMIIGHSDLAPIRKPDPGKAFPWELLAQNGIGLWPKNAKLSESDPAKLLSLIGYDVSSSEKLIAAAYAFRRHFLPHDIITMPVKKLVENPYPKGKQNLLSGEGFISALQATAKTYFDYAAQK